MEQERNYKYDNMRLLLIFLVIAGHGIELISKGDIYRVIYSFHMPAFLYLTGKFAKFDKTKIFRHLIVPYFVFQTLYICFDALFLKNEAISLQYTKPYWILWYLLAVIVFYLLIPMLPSKQSAAKYFLMAVSVIIALFCGFDNTVGYYLSLSRILVFAPFFLVGYYENSVIKSVAPRVNMRFIKVALLISCIAIIVVGEFHLIEIAVKPRLLYGSFSYDDAKATIYDRGIATAVAFAWIYLLKIVIPNKKIPFVTSFGANTMSVFLLHGFVLRIMKKYSLLHYSSGVNMLIVCGAALLMILIFGNKYFGRIFKKVF